MSTLTPEKSDNPLAMSDRPPVINDFSIVAATANGTGSQSANLTILRSFFKMGIPVHGKNIFPSNIQGLPTWYHIRVSHEGYVARPGQAEILIAFNRATVNDDIMELPSGGVCIYNADWKSVPEREDITYYPVPVKEFVMESGVGNAKMRSYIANMVYVGALAQLIDIPLESIQEALNFQFNGKAKAVESNMIVVRMAYNHFAENVTKQDPYKVEKMDKTEGLILMTGNEAAGLGSVFGGVSFAAWYPITPSTSVIDAFSDHLPAFRTDPETGKANYAVIQAEDELAAIGMVIGAGWAGARAMTATSGPGISLMAEFAGMAYMAEIPAVIWNIQRVGPSTGLPTRTGQCDVTFSYYLGHGDTKNVLLFPSDIQECFDFGTTAHNLADRLQTLVLVLSDLDLGMNNWMSEPLKYPDEPIDQGKVLTAQDITDRGSFSRYLDIDGDGIPYRTLPGNEHPQSAYFTRGTGHNEHAAYSEKSEDWLANMARLEKKFNTARDLVPSPVVDSSNEEIGIIAYGTSRYAIEEARDRLAAQGVKTDFMRLRALPINQDVHEFVASHKVTYVIELNRDGQAHSIIQSEMPELATKLKSLALLDGMPLTPRWIVEAINSAQKELS